MTRNEKIRKLANAVKDFRGLYLPPMRRHDKPQCIRPKQDGAMSRVCLWLERLNLPVDETLHQIRSFKSYQEFNEWLRTL